MTRSLRELAFRIPAPSDAPQIAELVVGGFETYRAFAPAGWDPPPLAHETATVAAALAKPGTWCRIAEDGAELVGHVGFLAAQDARVPLEEPGFAHFWQLFVRQDWWGSGLAKHLHEAALAAALQRGHTGLRLFTPAGHARGRRFYEREGWTLHGEPLYNEAFEMLLAEYRRSI